jgi:hypothetical protein
MTAEALANLTHICERMSAPGKLAFTQEMAAPSPQRAGTSTLAKYARNNPWKWQKEKERRTCAAPNLKGNRFPKAAG